MNKSDLVKYVSDKTMITERDANIIVDVFLNGVTEALDAGEKVMLKNFGTFLLQERKARTALNPRNQQVVDVPAKTVVKFKSSKKLYSMVNK